MALLHLMAEWRAEGEVKPDVTVLTVDHGLRAESREEAAMVARMAERLGLDHAILTWTEGARQSGGLQERAREARYDLMAAYCHAHDIPALVTAHHLDDQAETFLMRLKRGSGLDGLAAIPEKSVWSGIAVLRPLLDMPKARLAATLTTAGLGWAEDPSNRDERFERARMRTDSEALAKLGLTPEALARSARRLRRARAALDAAAQTFLATHGVMSEAGYCLIERAALIAAPEEIALRALARSVNAVSGRESPLQLGKLESLLEGLSENPKAAHTLGGCRLQPLGGRLGVFRETRGTGTAFAPARSRGTRAVGQPLRRRASEQCTCSCHCCRPRRGALARSSRLSALARRTAALRRRDAACVLRWGPDPGSDSRPGCRCGGWRRELNSARDSSMRLRLSANVPHLKDGIEEPCTS